MCAPPPPLCSCVCQAVRSFVSQRDFPTAAMLRTRYAHAHAHQRTPRAAKHRTAVHVRLLLLTVAHPVSVLCVSLCASLRAELAAGDAGLLHRFYMSGVRDWSDGEHDRVLMEQMAARSPATYAQAHMPDIDAIIEEVAHVSGGRDEQRETHASMRRSVACFVCCA